MYGAPRNVKRPSARTNPNNLNHPLARMLTRLLSGPVINYRQQNPSHLKRYQLDKFKTKFKSLAGLSFKKANYSPFDNIYADRQLHQARTERYIEFDEMENESIISSALDLYADEMTTSTPIQPILNIDCSNEEIKDVLQNLFYNILNVPFNLPVWTRQICKKGDMFAYLDIDENYGIVSLIILPSNEIERLETEDPTNPNYVQFQMNSAGMTFEQWQIAHFRLLGNDKHYPYGTSVLDPIRRGWRQYDLMKNVMMAYRIVRSAERRVFYVDVGGIPENEVENHMQAIINEAKKRIIIDPDTGRADVRYDPMSIDEDFFLPIRGNESGTRIDTLPGGQYTGDIDDVKFLRDEVISGLKIPHSYLMQTEDGNEEKTTLAQKDIHFARTIGRYQRNIVSELEQIARIHLAVLGYTGKDLLSFTLSLNNPSKIAEIQELEHWRTKFEVAAAATQGYFSKRFVAKEILGLSDEEFLRNQREMFYDAKFESSITSIAEAGDEEMGDLGGLDSGDDLDLSPDPTSSDAAEGDSTLLAAPGKRDDGHTTPRSKGKVYIPVATDKRDMGARKRSYHGSYNQESAKNTTRNVFKGYGDLNSLAKGIFEEYENEYEDIIKSQNKEIITEDALKTNNKIINNFIDRFSSENWKEKNSETKTRIEKVIKNEKA